MILHFTAERQRGRFAGFSLYVSNTTDRHDGYLCYKDGPVLPLLDFNTNCITNGRYVIFYNERQPRTTYPSNYVKESVFMELCEVTVTGMLKMLKLFVQFRPYELKITNNTALETYLIAL